MLLSYSTFLSASALIHPLALLDRYGETFLPHYITVEAIVLITQVYG